MVRFHLENAVSVLVMKLAIAYRIVIQTIFAVIIVLSIEFVTWLVSISQKTSEEHR